MMSILSIGAAVALSLAGAGMHQPAPNDGGGRTAFTRLLNEEFAKCARQHGAANAAEALEACRRRAFDTAGALSRFIICPGDNRCTAERRAAGVR